MQGASFWAERLEVPTLSVSKAIILNIVVFCVCPLVLMLCIVVKLVALGHSGNNIYCCRAVIQLIRKVYEFYGY